MGKDSLKPYMIDITTANSLNTTDFVNDMYDIISSLMKLSFVFGPDKQSLTSNTSQSLNNTNTTIISDS
jgi:hypothetical protein